MKINYLFLVLFILPFISNSQIAFTTESRSQIYDGYSNSGEWNWRKRDALTSLRYNTNRTFTDYEFEKIIGNAYYEKEFVSGNILFKNKKIDKKYALRYNAYRDEVEVSNDGGIEYLTKNPNISCLIGKKKYVFYPFTRKESEHPQIGYLELIYEGQGFNLFERKIKKYKPEKKAKTTLTTSVPAKLIDQIGYYFSSVSDVAIYLKSKKKSLINQIKPEYQTKMNAYIKEKHLDFKQKKDIIAFFKYYDSLITNPDSTIN